jgi:Protein of unknown function (DUF4235)
MSKILFVPFSVIGGILAGIVARKTVEAMWGVFDDEDVPDPKFRDIALKKLVPALLLEGAIFSAVRGLVDHGARHAFSRATGTWPGAERPESA